MSEINISKNNEVKKNDCIDSIEDNVSMTTERIIETIIPPEHAEVRLDSYLSKRFDYLSRNQWQKAIKNGEILLNNHRTRSARILHENDVIKYVTNFTEPAVEMKYSIIFEDEHFLIVNKGGNLPCHPAGPFFKNTLLYDLEKKYGKNSLFLVNRLDRETSGLMILTKNSALAAQMSEVFKTRAIEKEYLSIVHNDFKEYVDANGFLFDDSTSEVRKKRQFNFEKPCDSAIDYESSRTELFLEERFKNYSLVKAKLHTGRMHQIRATLYSLGFPLVGDKLYGTDDLFFIKFVNGDLTEFDLQSLILPRQALHSWRLKFIHPVTQEELNLMAPLPEDMKIFLESLKITL
ncbi:RluA family pseudouridine synthase [Lentisphaerota bacterium WC36G]|nr:RluA family pseudouridine synthase [Lentisphaerae bacterium WC36]